MARRRLGRRDPADIAKVQIAARGVPSKHHIGKRITHFGIYREGSQEATTLEIAWFDEHLKRCGGETCGSKTAC